MVQLCIVGLIVAFVIFAELYSIRDILKSHVFRIEYNQEIEAQLSRTKWALQEQNEALRELSSLISEKCDFLTQQEKSILDHAKYVASKFEPDKARF